jgi:hypothetical protein
VVKTKIDQHDHTTSFNSAWDDLKGRFEALRAFSGNLATAFPNTTSVESVVSILKWEKDDKSQSNDEPDPGRHLPAQEARARHEHMMV